VVCGAYAQTCICPFVSQKQNFDKADIVGKALVQKRNQTENQVTYEVTFQRVFKPANGQNDTRQVTTPLTANKCGVPTLIVGQSYLIAAKNNGSKLEITTCDSIGPRLLSKPIGPTLWSAVPAILLKRLESGKL